MPVLLTLLLEVVCDVIAAQAVVEESTAISWEPTNADNTRLLILGARVSRLRVSLIVAFYVESALA